ncbi:CusA/CzcA family heavy metal efflux RND transporter [Chitinophaga caeni]|uniref:CusA/CzcA family heavy metal efflux RND transporter n=1 Tax=Chitinophaga caeni TaxID=2029983 RepID=A0A291QUT6_9BACT|nr:CusA/CzcA family heavy metal efflux RND transporter [Chitinophaga caeni]ATL47681.1 CusA/CzcA family heavy metal efflux RND transporter [Chitinophaga caeni]
MLEKIIAFSIRQKLIVGIMTLALLGWGIFSLTRLPIDAVPDITNNQVQVITVSPSLAAQEIEQFVTFPVEQSMATIPGMVELRSISRFGLSVLTVVFEDDMDPYLARQLVQERIILAKEEIPSSLGSPEMMPMTTGLGEIYQYVIHAKKGYEDKYNATELRSIQDWIVRRQLLGTPGVADVSSFGGYLKQYEVAIDPDKLRSMNISINEVFEAVQKNNENSGGAYIEKQPNTYYIRAEGLVRNEQDIENIVVKNTSGMMPVLVRDIATVRIGSALRYGALTLNTSGEAVGAIVLMIKGANSSAVIRDVKARIEKIKSTLPEGVDIEPFLDRTKLVNNAIDTVTRNLVEGALIVIFLLVLLLGNLRAGLIVASVIPLSMLFAISMMNLFGVSGNLMSLGAIDFGLIVDGAVIVVEASLYFMATHFAGKKLEQSQMDEVVGNAARRIMSSAVFGQIIILIVYLPILALTGIEGKMFKPMAQTVSFAILGACLLSLTYVPMMSALFLSKKVKAEHGFSEKIIDAMHRVYEPILKKVLQYKRTVIISVILIFSASIFIFSNLGGEFIPSLDEGDFAVEVRLRTGTSLTHTIEVVDKASKILLENFEEVEKVVGKIGSSEIPTDPMPVEACDLMVILKPKSKWVNAETKDELAEKMQAKLAAIPGIDFGFQQPIQMRFNELMTGARQDVVVKIWGEDLQVLSEQAKKLGQIAQNVDGAKDIYVEKVTGLPQIVIRYNRAAMAKYGLDVSSINQTIRTAFAGESAGLVYEGERRFDLVLRLKETNRRKIDDVQNLYVATADGFQVPLTELADVKIELGPNQIQREEAKRRIIVAFNVRGRDVASIVHELETKVNANLKLPAGYYVTYGGAFENLEAAKSRLGIAVPVALLLIFILLYFAFSSVKYSVLIFTAIPLSAIGGIFALWARGMNFSVSAGVGFIALFGVAVLNGIVLITEFNRLKAEGMNDVYERVLKGTAVRLRPVMMTALVASFGFVPMALSNGSGAEVQQPLGTVVIGGLVSATMLTLLVLPVLYVYFESGWKPKPFKALTILLLMSIALPKYGKAQETKKISEQEAIEIALKQHPSIKSKQLEIDATAAGRGTSLDLGKTEISGQFGQNNSLAKDNHYTISQSFEFPTVYSANASLNDAKLKGKEMEKEMTAANLILDVKKAYQQLLFLQQQKLLLMELDSIYSRFEKMASVKVRTGESAKLEQVTAATQMMESRNKLQNVEAEEKVWYKQLSNLLQLPLPFQVASPLAYDTIAYSLQENGQVSANPFLKISQQNEAIASAVLKTEKNKWLPGFTLGYFNQSLVGYQEVNGTQKYFDRGDRFDGFIVGLSLPLWFKPISARTKMARLQREATVMQTTTLRNNLQTREQQLTEEWLKQVRQVNYYKNSALPQADLMQGQAERSYKEGEIGYLQYWQHLQQINAIKQAYLAAIRDHNLAVLELQFIHGDFQAQ